MRIQTTRGPNGQDLVLISLNEYEDQMDAHGHTATMQAVAPGAMETLSEEDAAAYLGAETALAVWRRDCGVTQRALAGTIGVLQARIGQIQNGVREGNGPPAPLV